MSVTHLRVVESTCSGLVLHLNGNSVFFSGLKWRVLVVSVLVLALFPVADHELLFLLALALAFQLHPKRDPLSVLVLNAQLCCLIHAN